MFSENSVNQTVRLIMSSFAFENVSDLTEEQLSQIITKSIYNSMRSSDYIEYVSNQLALKARRRG